MNGIKKGDRTTAVLRLNFCAKLNICASISATSPSCKTLSAIIKKAYEYRKSTLQHSKISNSTN